MASVGFHSAGSAPFGTTAELDPVSKDGEASTSSVKHGMGIELVCSTQGKYHDDGSCLCSVCVYKCNLYRHMLFYNQWLNIIRPKQAEVVFL